MSVKKEASGRRSVQVEVEVPGTPEEVWQAIATGPGISSWFVPAEFEVRDGKPVAVKLNFGPGMESTSAVTAWEPPQKWASQSDGWVPGSPPIANEWSLEMGTTEMGAAIGCPLVGDSTRGTETAEPLTSNPATWAARLGALSERSLTLYEERGTTWRGRSVSMPPVTAQGRTPRYEPFQQGLFRRHRVEPVGTFLSSFHGLRQHKISC